MTVNKFAANFKRKRDRKQVDTAYSIQGEIENFGSCIFKEETMVVAVN